MIEFTVDSSGVMDYMEATKKRIFAGVMVGMKESMEGLAVTVAEKMGGDPIVSRTGALLRKIMACADRQPLENDVEIKGTLSTWVGKYPLGVWLEEGTNVPATFGTPKAVLYGFTASDGKSVFTHGHGAFRVAPHPFLNPSLDEYSPTILDLIQQRVAEAVDADV